MTDRLRLTIDLDLPDDLFARSEFITRIGVPFGIARTALAEIVGTDVAIKHEIVSDAPAPVVKRGRKPRAALPVQPMPTVVQPASASEPAPAADAPAKPAAGADRSRKAA